MLMTSIFVVNGRIYHHRFKCNYLKNQIHFCAFYCILLPFLLNLHYIWNILKKNWTSYLTYFWNYWLWKMSLAWCIKGRFWKHFGSQSVKRLRKTNLPKTFLWHLRINVADPICNRRKDLHQKKQRKRKVFYLNAIKQVKL